MTYLGKVLVTGKDGTVLEYRSLSEVLREAGKDAVWSSNQKDRIRESMVRVCIQSRPVWIVETDSKGRPCDWWYKVELKSCEKLASKDS
jgi:hypothetical protein